MSETIIAPGATLGILGGGQLGRMIASAAARLGLKVHVFNDTPASPAFALADVTTCAPFTDEAALSAFAQSVDVATYEFENVPREAAALVAGLASLRPGVAALATSQDRLAEKRFVADLGIRTAPFRPVDDAADLEAALAAIGMPAILKTRRFGYDGKGQAAIRTAGDAAPALAAMKGAPSILEGFVDFVCELSVVAARAPDGSFAAFDICENRHENHILALTSVPAGVSAATAQQAREIAHAIASALDYVGVFAVELFLTRDASGREDLVVNEIAPRVHNSGHWTDFGAQTSQFEQHVRAVCGWPLGPCDRLGRVEMRNLIGDDIAAWRDHLADPQAHLTLYGKEEARPGRKMGHVTWVY
ncbi:MAG: 5-(carboxyamino)imidazole ribonucleotide synthase [Salinarimonas sp.]